MTSSRPRFLSLDVMRGLTLALMIVVNMSIDWQHSYAQLLHAQWNGLTLTDVVFPTFLFVSGASMSFALNGWRTQSDARFFGKILRRSALIFLCGYLLYWFPFLHQDESGRVALLPIGNTRIFGVLQRIAVDYFLVAVVVRYIDARGALLLAAIVLLGYWAVMANFGDYTLQGNAAVRVDLFFLGPSHVYHGEGVPFDPEGILGSLPAAVNMLAGYLAGRSLVTQQVSRALLSKFVGIGVACIAVALVWSCVFPINKKLWTSSYVLCTIGIDLCVLAALVVMVDPRGSRGIATYFFEVFGKNTLFIYLLSEIGNALLFLISFGGLTAFSWLYKNAFQTWMGDKGGSLLFALAYMLGCWLVAWQMDRRRIYISL